MTSLVLLDHEAGAIKQPSRSAVAAAAQLGEVHVLVAGHGVDAAAAAAAKLPGVAKVHKADSPLYEHALAEPLAALLVSMAPHHSHLVAASSTVGKNVMPRVAALLDVQPISDISGIIDADTFVRPIYACNALATVRSSDAETLKSSLRPAGDAVAVTIPSAMSSMCVSVRVCVPSPKMGSGAPRGRLRHLRMRSGTMWAMPGSSGSGLSPGP